MLRVRRVWRSFSRRSLFFGAALVLCLIPAAAAAQSQDSQDAAEAARQEKARRAAAAKSEKKETHVYTNDDLKRSQILTPEHHAQVEARKKNQTPSPKEQPMDTLDAAAPKAPDSLGEVARRFRREKAAREAEQALKVPQPLRLPSELSQPALASPRSLPVRPLTSLVQPAKPTPPAIGSPSGRRDPFARPAFSVSPNLPSRALSAMPAAPRITNKVPPPSQPIVATPRIPVLRAPTAIEPRPVAPSALIAPAVATSRITVQPGDSLWKLSRLRLGKGSRWHDFLAVNPSLASPDRLRPGVSLVVPLRNNQPSAPTVASTTSTTTVQAGDSLWKIAAAHFGSGIHWLCLARANPQIRDSDRIYPGQALFLPATCGSTP